eukprot:21309-Heterococcus_DN1.PRE.1
MKETLQHSWLQRSRQEATVASIAIATAPHSSCCAHRCATGHTVISQATAVAYAARCVIQLAAAASSSAKHVLCTLITKQLLLYMQLLQRAATIATAIRGATRSLSQQCSSECVAHHLFINISSSAAQMSLSLSQSFSALSESALA